MKAKEFMIEKERQLIDVFGVDDWAEEKVYTVDEVIKFMQEFALHSAQERYEKAFEWWNENYSLTDLKGAIITFAKIASGYAKGRKTV